MSSPAPTWARNENTGSTIPLAIAIYTLREEVSAANKSQLARALGIDRKTIDRHLAYAADAASYIDLIRRQLDAA